MEPSQFGLPAGLDRTEAHRDYHNSMHNQFEGSILQGGQTFNFDGQDEQDRHLSKLPCADGAAFNSRLREHEPQCLPNTRVDLLKQIMTWSNNPSGTCIFWLNGMAGTGKSTIAQTVARACADQNRLGASFFFSRGRGDLSHSAKFITSLAAQLAITLPTLKPYICSAIVQNPDIIQRGLSDQWKHLIFQPLANLRELSLQLQVFVLVIDALDECEGEDDIRLIVRLLAEAKTLNTIRLRAFITSRPETRIHFGFRAISETAYQDFVLHDIPRSIVQHDISVFLNYELESIRIAYNICEGWPGDAQIRLLCQRASVLFIYASTACRFIRDPSWGPYDGLSFILEDDNRELDEMYTRILMHSIIDEDRYRRYRERISCEVRQIVGSIIILFDSLSASMLATLLDVPVHTVCMRLQFLHSVLDVPTSQESPIRLLHPSFRDFLLDQQRCRDSQLWIDKKKAHGDLFVSCLKLMSKHLQRDMCNLRLPGALVSEITDGVVKDCLPLDVQYACRYWVGHLEQSKVTLRDNDQVHIFLRKHFLHWLEALSLIGKISDGVLMVRSLADELMPKSVVNSDLHDMVYDAKRFVLNNRSIMEIAPLQLYSSALVFSPKTSAIRGQFWDQIPRWIKNIPAVQENWSPALQSLEGHSEGVKGVAFSPNGQLLASASWDNTVKLWDTSTGAFRCTLESHSFPVYAVAFSPDGQLLASASEDSTVRLWDPSTGASRYTFESDSLVNAVEFSPDGQLLALASDDHKVRLRDPSTGASCCTLEGHSSNVRAVAFSPDGGLLASASMDKTVRLWDPSTGASRCTLEDHSSHVYAVAFSPDGQLLASASGDNTVRLWDPSTGASRCTITGPSLFIYAVAFSPDSQLLAVASSSGVRLWDPSTGASHCTLDGHSSAVSAVAFSPDGQLLASASFDKTVKLWDLSTIASHSTLAGRCNQVYVVAFSPDGQLLASGSLDMTLKLWDSSTGTSRCTLEGHSSRVCAITFSPDGQLLASASEDSTVRLWDPSTGASRYTLEGHPSVCAVKFSPDGQLLAVILRDFTVRLWDPSTGAFRCTLEGHPSFVRAVAFSPDSQLLASASSNKVRLWDLSTGASHCTLEGHSSDVSAVAFSRDGQFLASASSNKVRLWDASTGAPHSTLEGHSSDVNAVAFSPDGQLLASASSDDTVRLWDINTKDIIQSLPSELYISELAFCSNGSYLETSRGILELQHLPHYQSRFPFTSNPCPLYVGEQWVKWGTENILWLPPDYRQRRSACVAVRHNILAIGYESDRVTFIEIDPKLFL